MKKVLIVDDASMDQNTLKEIVEKSGFTPLICENGMQAVKMAKFEQPDLIFMDVNMPQMDGFQATREILSLPECINSKIIFVTAKNQKADQVWAKMLGARGFISKPFKAEQITNELQKNLS